MELFEIGYFAKTHGIKGHLILKTESFFDTEELNALFVETGGSKAPYFITELRETNDAIIILLEDINSVEKAKTLTGKKVFIDSKFISEDEMAEEDWSGFELIDKAFGSLGQILSTSDNGQQILVSILFKGKEVILPLVEEFIESIDEEKKIIRFNAPEGLIDIYLDI